MSAPCISVIVPAYNRAAVLPETLSALAEQTLVPPKFEVIVVDDGSSDGTGELLTAHPVPYTLRLCRKDHSGAAASRNEGARLATGQILVFLDADMVAAPHLLSEHYNAQLASEGLVFGHRSQWPPAATSVLSRTIDLDTNVRAGRQPTYQEAFSANLSVAKKPFWDLDGFDGSFAACEDVDFAYRALLRHVPVSYRPRALAYHNHPLDLDGACRRECLYHRSYARLFSKHPELASEIRHVQDKFPVALGDEPLSLSARKLARQLLARSIVLRTMERLAMALERLHPNRHLLRPLYWKILASYQLNGLREGIRLYHWEPRSD